MSGRADEDDGAIASAAVRDDGGNPVEGALELLRRHHRVDFRDYRPTVLARRLARRARLAGTPRLDDYLELLGRRPEELRALRDDLLSEPTAFFRDRDAFECVERLVVPALVERLRAGAPPRLWVPGCASGEEPWSLAMLLAERAEAEGLDLRATILATDVHPGSLGRAEVGEYPARSVAHLPPGRVERFFEPSLDDASGSACLRVREPLRRLVEFRDHDLLTDPAPGRFDLVCCRNVLTHFDVRAQRRVLAGFRDALGPGAWLVLGPRETTAGLVHGFDTIDSRWRVHRRRSEASERPAVPVPPRWRGDLGTPGDARADPGRPDADRPPDAGPDRAVGHDARVRALERELAAARAELERTAARLDVADQALASARMELDTVGEVHRHRDDELEGARRALARVGHEHRDLVDDVGGFAVRWRRDDTAIAWCTPAYARLFDVAPESLVGRRLDELLPADELRSLLEAVGDLGPGEARRTETVHELPDGEETCVVAVTRAIADDAGDVVEYRSTGRDRTASHRQRRDLEALVDLATDPWIGSDAVLSRLLRIATRHLGLEGAIVARHVGDDYRVVETSGAVADHVEAGAVLRLSATYCDALPARGSARAVGHVARSELADHPCRAATGIEAWVGTRLTVHGEPFGSVSFVARSPSARPFGATEERFALAAGGWVSNLLERRERRDGPTGGRRRGGIVGPSRRSPAPLAADVAGPGPSATEGASAGLDRFAFAASHELQEPLGKIRRFAAFLAEDAGESLDAEGRYQLRVIERSAERMSRLVRGLLSYSRTVHSPLSRDRIDLGAVAREVIDEHARKIDAAGAEVRLDPLPEVRADATLVRRALSALLTNALEHPDPARPLTVRVGASAGAVLEVVDDGAGFDPAAAGRITELFARLPGADGHEGCGIGLALCAVVCERHGWTLRARGVPGAGATFRIEPGGARGDPDGAGRD